MQVSIETTTGLERRLTIVIDSNGFEDQVTQRLKATAKRVRLPGFRPGKVPMKEVRRRFGAPVRQEVAGELMQKSFFEAIQQEDLSPASQPKLDVLKMEPGTDFEFTATFEVYPSIELRDLSQVHVKKPVAHIVAEDVDKMLDTLRQQRKIWKPVERVSAEGDQVSVDFVGKIDAESFDGGSGEDVQFELGQGQMLPEFENAVMGQPAGVEVTADVTFPENYQSENLRGKTAHFDISLKQVSAAELPELDEDFFSSLGVEEGGLEALRQEIEENMQRELDAAVRGQIKKQVLDELARLHEFSIPATLVQQEAGNLKNQMLKQFSAQAQGQNLPELPDDMFLDEAEKRVRTGLVINRLIESEEMQADPEAVRARIEELAQPYSDPDQVVNWYYSNEEQLAQIEMAVLEDRVIERVLEQARVEEIETDYDSAISGRGISAGEEADAENAAGSTSDTQGAGTENCDNESKQQADEGITAP